MVSAEKAGILGLDPGEKRIGLAIAHRGLAVAAGLGFIEYTGKKNLISQLRPIIAEEDVGLVIIGLPVNMNGTEGESAKNSRRLAEIINRELKLDVDFVDERLTTEQAAKLFRESAKKAGRNKGTIDMISAVVILQTYLDIKKI